MKKLFFRYSYLICIASLLACQSGEDPEPDTGNIVDSPKERKAFFTTQEQRWKLHRMTFSEPTLVPEISKDPNNIDSTKITDLYVQLPTCRKDDVYSFGYEYGNVLVNFMDEGERCDPQEPSQIEKGIYLEFNDPLTVAQAAFRNNHAVHHFLGFAGNQSGSGYLGYTMEWKVESLSTDSINIEGIFIKRDLPALSIQFVPVESR